MLSPTAQSKWIALQNSSIYTLPKKKRNFPRCISFETECIYRIFEMTSLLPCTYKMTWGAFHGKVPTKYQDGNLKGKRSGILMTMPYVQNMLSRSWGATMIGYNMNENFNGNKIPRTKREKHHDDMIMSMTRILFIYFLETTTLSPTNYTIFLTTATNKHGVLQDCVVYKTCRKASLRFIFWDSRETVAMKGFLSLSWYWSP